MLCKKYQVNGQTAWSLLKKAERFLIKIVTQLDEADVQKMRMNKMDLDNLSTYGNDASQGYIFPTGAKFLIRS